MLKCQDFEGKFEIVNNLIKASKSLIQNDWAFQE